MGRKRKVGRPPDHKLPPLKLQLTPEQWKLLEQYSITPTSTFMGLARMIGIKTSRPDQTLQRLIKRQYKKDEHLWLNQQHEEGIAKFGQAFFNSCIDAKGNPILKIFGGKNWLGLKDEKTIKRDDESNDSLKTLQLMHTIINKISDNKQSIPITQQLESNSTRSEYATITPIQPQQTVTTSQPIDTTIHSDSAEQSNIDDISSKQDEQ